MTVLGTNRTVVQTPSAFARAFARPVIAVVSALAAWNDARATRRSLSRLSDHDLSDLGFVRGDIDALAERRR